jgi:hypothetical protein
MAVRMCKRLEIWNMTAPVTVLSTKVLMRSTKYPGFYDSFGVRIKQLDFPFVLIFAPLNFGFGTSRLFVLWYFFFFFSGFYS